MIHASASAPVQYVRCQGCNAKNPTGAAFCEGCGERMRRVQGVANPRPAQRTSRKRRSLGNVADEETERQIKGARIAIMCVAILTVIATAIMHGMFNSELQKAQNNASLVIDSSAVSQMKLLIHAQYAVAGLFVGLFFWAKSNPFAATLTALIIYVSSHLAGAAVDPESLSKGIFVKIIVVAALVNGVKSGLAFRQTQH